MLAGRERREAHQHVAGVGDRLYASIRLTLSWVSATRLPRVIVERREDDHDRRQSASSGPSASTNSRRISANAPTLGPTDR